jgi:flagellar assembly protein FliH
VTDLEAIERAASEEGFQSGHAQGLAQGLAQGEKEVRQLADRLQGLLEAFARPLTHFDSEVEAALGELAVQVAGVLVGRAYAAEPALLAQLVEEALRLAGAEARAAEVRLHPDDLAALEPLLAAADMPRARLTADASLARGDLRVHTEALRIDGTLAARLQVALLTLAIPGEAR